MAIVGIALVAVAVSLALSLSKEKTYEATATARVKSTSELLGVAGLLPAQGELPAQTAAQTADAATSAGVLRRVIEKLDLNLAIDELRPRVSANQDAQSNLVNVEASGPTGEQAANLANATLTELARSADLKLQKRYAKLADRDRKKLESLQRSTPKEVSGLSPQQQAALNDRASQRHVLSETIAKLATLANTRGVVEVTNRAEVPGSAASPKPIASAAFGLILGLLLGSIVATVLEALDQRLRRADEAEALLDVPLVGVVAEKSMGETPISDEDSEDHVAMMDSFRMLRNNVRFLERERAVQTILVTSPLAEEGKTTVAIGMAIASAAGGQNTLLIEADLHRPVHSGRLGIERTPGLVDHLRGSASPKEVLRSVTFVDPEIAQRLRGSANGQAAEANKARLACIPAGELAGMSSEVLGSPPFKRFLDQVKRVYDVIIIDTAPLLAVAETSELVELSDAVVLCVRINQTTADQALAAKEALRRLPERPTGLAITGFKPTSSDAYSYYSYAYSYRFDPGAERRRRLFGRHNRKDDVDQAAAGTGQDQEDEAGERSRLPARTKQGESSRSPHPAARTRLPFSPASPVDEPMRVLVTGGSGFIGTNLLARLRADGHTVTNIDVAPPRAGDQRPFWLKINLLDSDALRDAVLETSPTHVVHLAARTDLEGKSIDDYAANTVGTRNVLAALDELADAPRLLAASTRMVCEIGYQPMHDEDYHPPNAYGESKVETERIVRRSSYPGTWTLFRPTSVWGPWFDVPYRNFFLAVANGRYRHPAGRQVRKSFGYVENHIYQLIALMSAPGEQVHERTMYLADYQPLDVEDWATRISRISGGPPVRTLSMSGLRGLAVAGDALKLLGWHQPPLTRFRLQNLVTEMIYDLGPIQEVAPTLPVSLNAGVERTVHWLQAQGDLPSH